MAVGYGPGSDTNLSKSVGFGQNMQQPMRKQTEPNLPLKDACTFTHHKLIYEGKIWETSSFQAPFPTESQDPKQ